MSLSPAHDSLPPARQFAPRTAATPAVAVRNCRDCGYRSRQLKTPIDPGTRHRAVGGPARVPATRL